MKNKLSIIICDDEPIIVDIISDKIDELINRNKYPAYIAFKSSIPDEILELNNKNDDNCLYFLDIDLGENNINGIDISKFIKKKNSLAKIVFITNDSGMSYKVLREGTEALGFIEKINTEFIGRNLKKYIELAISKYNINSNENDDSISLEISLTRKIDILKSEIIYIETNKLKAHNINYHTVSGSVFTVRDTIKSIGNKLGKTDFMYSTRGILINKAYVLDIENGMVLFSTGDKCPCSFTGRKKVKIECMI